MYRFNNGIMESSSLKASKYFVKNIKAVDGKNKTTGEMWYQYLDYRFCLEASFSSSDSACSGKHLLINWSIKAKSGCPATFATKDTRRFSQVVYTYQSKFDLSSMTQEEAIAQMEKYVTEFTNHLLSYDFDTEEFEVMRPCDLTVSIDLPEAVEEPAPVVDYTESIEALGAEVHADHGVEDGVNVWYEGNLVWSGILDSDESSAEALTTTLAYIEQYNEAICKLQSVAEEVMKDYGYDVMWANFDSTSTPETFEDGNLRVPMLMDGDEDYISDKIYDALDDDTIEVLGGYIEEYVDEHEEWYNEGLEKAIQEYYGTTDRVLIEDNGYNAWAVLPDSVEVA